MTTSLAADDRAAAAATRIRARLPLHTAQTVLREVRLDDVDAIRAYRQLPEVAACLPHPPLDAETAGALVARWVADPLSVDVAVEVGGSLVGDVRLFLRPCHAKAPARTDELEARIGYAVHPGLQGQGLATEAVREVVGLAFSEGGVRRVTARVFAPATASSRLLARLGFTHEGTERAAVRSPDGSSWWDDEAWSLLRSDVGG